MFEILCSADRSLKPNNPRKGQVHPRIHHIAHGNKRYPSVVSSFLFPKVAATTAKAEPKGLYLIQFWQWITGTALFLCKPLLKSKGAHFWLLLSFRAIFILDQEERIVLAALF